MAPLPPRVVLWVFGLVAALYLATATWTTPYNVDAYTNVLQSWSFARDGSPVIEEYEHLLEEKYTGHVVWIVESPRGPTSQYPPGVALWGAPFYLLDTSSTPVNAMWSNQGEPEVVLIDVPSLLPGGLAAVTSVTIAMVFFFLTLRRVLEERTALVATLVAALGTGAWSVAADQLWQHGPAMMCISIGTYCAATDRFGRSGLAFAGAVLIRPHTGIIAAAIGLTVAIRRRQLGPLVRTGAGSLVGLALVVAYNWAVWGSPSISGGYSAVFSDRVRTTSPVTLARRIGETLVHLDHGVLVSSPFLVLAIVALARGAGRRCPDWALGGAIGGAVYLLVQLQANRASGGSQFFGYRYPLEALMAAGPLLALAVATWVAGSPRRRRLLGVLAGASILAHGYGAVFVGS